MTTITAPPLDRPDHPDLPAGDAPGTDHRSGRPSDDRTAPRFHIAAEVALAVLTLATVFGFSRLFDSAGFWPSLVVVSLYSHVVLLTLRRRGVGVLASAAIGTLGLLGVLVITFFASTLTFGLPGGDTISAAGDALRQSWDTFNTAPQAPVPVETGFLLVSSLAIFFAVFLADWAAFRLWSSWEAIVPTATVFIFGSLLGSTEHRTESVLVFAVSAVAFLLLHRIARRETSAGWLSSDAVRGASSLLRIGAVVGIGAVLIGVFAAPHLPGADSTAILGRDANPKKGDRFTVSPLVEIRSRMDAQANVEMFTVRADRESYWRLTALDMFDGSTWRSRGKFVEAQGDLQPPLGDAERTPVTQEYQISNLARLWLPGAFQVSSVSDSAHARYHEESGTLIVDTDFATSDGLDYVVESLLPSFSAERLRTADNASLDPSFRDRYTELPPNWSENAPGLAREIEEKAGAATDYDRARALQDFFRDPENQFRYDLDVEPGHSGNAIDNFLRDRVGYCEHYAAAYAAMARSLGIPARVAVGFTWGERDPADPSLFRVRGEHAHAWPEVYLGQFGWVSFEPTPSRGAPASAAWTGIQPEQFQATTGNGGSSTSTTRVQPGGTALTGPGSTVTTLVAELSELETESQEEPLPPVDGPVAGAGSFVQVVTRLSAVLLVALVVAGVYAALVLAWLKRTRVQRAARARTANDHVLVAWASALDELALVNAVPEPTETHAEFGARATRLLPEAGSPVGALVLLLDEALYGGDTQDEGARRHAEQATAAVTQAVASRVPPFRQLVIRLNPAWVLRRARIPTTTHRATSTHIAGAT